MAVSARGEPSSATRMRRMMDLPVLFAVRPQVPGADEQHRAYAASQDLAGHAAEDHTAKTCVPVGSHGDEVHRVVLSVIAYPPAALPPQRSPHVHLDAAPPQGPGLLLEVFAELALGH